MGTHQNRDHRRRIDRSHDLRNHHETEVDMNLETIALGVSVLALVASIVTNRRN